MPVAKRVPSMIQTMGPILRYYNESAYTTRDVNGEISDFTFGNPHEMPIPQYVDAVSRSIQPQDKNWFAYMQNDGEAQKIISADLERRLGHQFHPEDILMTNGAFVALSVVINALVNPGDEVIFIEPYWFAYEGMIVGAGGVPVKVRVDLDTFDLDAKVSLKYSGSAMNFWQIS
ncbi:MAG: aminotransferase class I/II-fold pyridoxal phosphate-dependent enzyme [Chloroflexota bacterium]